MLNIMIFCRTAYALMANLDPYSPVFSTPSQDPSSSPWPTATDSYARYEQDISRDQQEFEEKERERAEKERKEIERLENPPSPRGSASTGASAPSTRSFYGENQAKDENVSQNGAKSDDKDDFGFTKVEYDSKKARRSSAPIVPQIKSYFNVPIEWIESSLDDGLKYQKIDELQTESPAKKTPALLSAQDNLRLKR